MSQLLRRLVVLQPGEAPALLASFATLLCTFSSYTILRPVRDAMGVTSGLEKIPSLWLSVFVVMLLLQPVYGWLTSRYSRAVFLPCLYGFFAANLLGFYLWFRLGADPTWIARGVLREAMVRVMEQAEVFRWQEQQRATHARDCIVERAAGEGGTVDALVQRTEQEGQHDTLGEERGRKPRLPAARPDQAAGEGEETRVRGELQRAARVRTPRQLANPVATEARNRQ